MRLLFYLIDKEIKDSETRRKNFNFIRKDTIRIRHMTYVSDEFSTLIFVIVPFEMDRAGTVASDK